MNPRLLTTLMVAALAWACLAQVGGTPGSPPGNPKPAVAGDNQRTNPSDLPNVLIIGDSISVGYTPPLRKLLQGRANVQRIPVNGGPTTNGLAQLKQWLGGEKWDVIHFNWGLHDLKIMADGTRQVPLASYAANLRELVRQLQDTGATLIWATTTPVPKEEDRLVVKRHTADVLLYNAAAREIMEEKRIRMDDLYSFALPRLKAIQQPADVHYTANGYAELAKQVAASIEAVLPKAAE